jgi:uncharacterized protein
MSEIRHLHVTWDEYHRLCEALALQVYDSGWRPDQILCLARGGLRVGDTLSRILDKPLAVLSTSSYRENSGTTQGKLVIGRTYTAPFDELSGRVLLVDDLVDSGVTLREVMRELPRICPAVAEWKSAVIWAKACSVIQPDYALEYLDDNPWIHQPFEEYDGIGVEVVRARLDARDKKQETR